MKIFPENVSVYGDDIDFLFWLITIVAGLATLIVLFLVIYPILTRKKHKAKENIYVKGEGFKQLKWIYLAIFVMAVADFSFLIIESDGWIKTQETLPEKDFHVAIVGKQWLWEIIYPGPDGKLYTADDVKKFNTMIVPQGAVIHMDLTAYDVLHSVFIPHARFKFDCLPGRKITRWVEFTKSGEYPMVCAEMCGVGHSRMVGKVVVLPQEKFEKELAKIYKK